MVASHEIANAQTAIHSARRIPLSGSPVVPAITARASASPITTAQA